MAFRRAFGAALALAVLGASAVPATAKWTGTRNAKRLTAWHEKQAGQRRSLLQHDHSDMAAAPMAAYPDALQTPENAAEVCTRDVLRKATFCANRRKVYWEAEDPDEECCQLLSKYYSNASKEPTRNCWCDADVWAAELLIEEVNYISLGTIFDACSTNNFTLGDEAVAYYQDGAGPCAGPTAAEEAAAAAEEMPAEEVPVPPPQRSFWKWVREGFPDNHFLAFAFAVSLLSALGFMLMLWPFLFQGALWLVIDLPARVKKTV